MTSLAQEIQRDEKLGKNGVDRFSERYSRQILFRGIGEEGQRKLAASSVALVGCGARMAALAGLLAPHPTSATWDAANFLTLLANPAEQDLAGDDVWQIG